jgi:predicted Zn finger-like uncharacterized protein
MSLVTRCPACTTTFKVVRDQLRISDGWVRCGRCSHVFDATLDLHEAPDGASAPVQGGYMPGWSSLPPSPRPKPRFRRRCLKSPSLRQAPSAPPAEPELPPPQSEDADFFDEEPEPPLADVQHAARAPEPTDAADAAEPAVPLVPAAFSLSLPDHGIAADEPWSDLDVSEPAWRPPPSTLPPFPNIDLNLASPPPAARPPPPPPPLPFTPRFLKTRAFIQRASEDGGGARERRARAGRKRPRPGADAEGAAPVARQVRQDRGRQGARGARRRQDCGSLGGAGGERARLLAVRGLRATGGPSLR